MNENKYIENIKAFNPNFVIEDWCYETLQSRTKVENYRFYNTSISKGIKEVPLDKVVGTSHDSYIGSTWISLVKNMKRFSDYYSAENFIEFISKDSSYQKDFSYEKYGDEYFVSQGNHRNCEAKFSGLKTIVTDVSEHILDIEMLETFQYLQEEGLSPKKEKENYSLMEDSEDRSIFYRTSGWKIKMLGTTYTFKDFKAIQKFIFLYKEIEPTFFNRLKIKFKKQEKEYWFEEKRDYKSLEAIIIQYKYNKNFS